MDVYTVYLVPGSSSQEVSEGAAFLYSGSYKEAAKFKEGWIMSAVFHGGELYDPGEEAHHYHAHDGTLYTVLVSSISFDRWSAGMNKRGFTRRKVKSVTVF